jgi:hypothetical protein
MSYTHIVNGDVAAAVLSTALLEAGSTDPVLTMRDDLPVGPLKSIDDDHALRAAFWKRVMGQTDRDVFTEFEQAAARLTALVNDESPVVIWHGQSAGDQLVLRRIAYHLRNTPQRINEIALTLQELEKPELWSNRPTAVGLYTPAALQARLKTIAPVSILRIGRLALEWQELKQMNSDLRRWRTNTFESGSYTEIDALILESLTDDWQPSAQLVGQIMNVARGFFATDVLIFWRCRELAATGRLSLRGNSMQMRSSEARAVAYA